MRIGKYSLENPLEMKSQVKTWTGVIIIAFGFYFISQGTMVFEIATSYQNQTLVEKFPESEDIQYHDPADQVQWINEFGIKQLDSDSNIVGNLLGIQVHVSVNEIPKEAAFHIFHEDSDVYFTGTEDYHYEAITNKLDKVPSLKYGDIYNVKFNPEETTGEKAPFTLNGFEHMAFDKPGTYNAQVSFKLQNGTIVHFHSTTSVFLITDGKHEWMINAMQILINEEANNKPLLIRSFGWAFIGIGVGLILSGISLLVAGIEKKLSVVEKLKKN